MMGGIALTKNILMFIWLMLVLTQAAINISLMDTVKQQSVIIGSVDSTAIYLNSKEVRIQDSQHEIVRISPDGTITVFTADGRVIATRLPNHEIVRGEAYSEETLYSQLRRARCIYLKCSNV